MTRQKIKSLVSSIALKDTELSIRLPLMVTEKDRSISGMEADRCELVIEENATLSGLFLLRSRAFLEHLLEKEGFSRNEIARQLKVSPAAVGTAIYRLGLLGPERSTGRTRRAPFGFDKHDGKLVKNDAEQKAILLMRQMQKSGESLRTIADELNRRRIPTKQGGVWQANTVNKILRVQPDHER